MGRYMGKVVSKVVGYNYCAHSCLVSVMLQSALFGSYLWA